MILIIGGLGNMGQRYSRILEDLELPVKIVDTHNIDMIDTLIEEATKVIITTPTRHHFTALMKVLDANKQVLCEKPITKNLKELDIILNHKNVDKLSMVNNYKYAYEKASRLLELPENNETSYNFVYPGPDGIGWDCIQLIYFSDGMINLDNSSHEWTAKINGYTLLYNDVINGYQLMLEDFVTFNTSNISLERLKLAHECANRIDGSYEESSHWDTAASKLH